MTDDTERWLDEVLNTVNVRKGNNTEAKAAIRNRIAAEVKAARIDELKHLIEVASEPLEHGRAMAEDTDTGELIYGVEESYFYKRVITLTDHPEAGETGVIGDVEGIVIMHATSPYNKRPHTDEPEDCWCWKEFGK